VARSDDALRRRLGLVALGIAGAAVVSGCSTTQDEAARLQLNAARIRAAEKHAVVRTAGHRLRVDRVSLVSSGHGSAFVVSVRNPGQASVADLPITVGVHQSGRGAVAVNRHSSDVLESYYDAHLPQVAAGQSVTWVYATPRSFPHGARPFARVGGRPSPAVTRVGEGTPPVLDVTLLSQHAQGAGRGQVRISLHNTSTVPQYQLRIYAVARAGARTVAGGEQTVPELGSHATQTVTVPVVGSLAHARVQLAAIPTINQ
jgi:hypothetical protein